MIDQKLRNSLSMGFIILLSLIIGIFVSLILDDGFSIAFILCLFILFIYLLRRKHLD